MINKHQQAFTLIELLIVSVISLILVAGVITVFLTIKNYYQLQQEMAQMQDNARVALDLLAQEIRAAGFIGCPRFSDSLWQLHFHNSSAVNMSPEQIIQGRQSFQMDSDELTLQFVDVTGTELTIDMSDNEHLTANYSHSFKKDEVIMISDCEFVEIGVVDHVATTGQQQILYLHKPVSHRFHQQAAINSLHVKRYFIKPTGRRNKQGYPIMALYVGDVTGVDQELVTGVSKMKITYAKDLSNDEKQSQFVTANQIHDWQHIVAAKIDLLIESDSEIVQEPTTYIFQNRTYAANDRRLHREWSLLVTLRSKSSGLEA